MSVQNPNDKLNINPSQFEVGLSEAKVHSSGTSKVDSTKNKPTITKESVAQTNKKIGSFQAKIIEANNLGGSITEKQNNLEKLETKVLKAQSFFKQIDAELNTLSARKDELNLKLNDLESSGSSAELYREELKSVTNQIREIKEASYGDGANLVSSALQQVQTSLAELKNNIELSGSELREQYPALGGLNDDDRLIYVSALRTYPNDSKDIIQFLNRLKDESQLSFFPAFKNIPPTQMMDVLRHSMAILDHAKEVSVEDVSERNLFSVIDMIGKLKPEERGSVIELSKGLFTEGMTEHDLVKIISVFEHIPSSERNDIVEHAKGLFTDDMSANNKSEIIKAFSENLQKDRQNLGLELSTLISGDNAVLSEAEIVKLVKAYAKLPSSEREGVVALAKTFSSDVRGQANFTVALAKISNEERVDIKSLENLSKSQIENFAGYAFELISEGNAPDNSYVLSLLENKECREKIIQYCEKKLQESGLSVFNINAISNFVYDNKAGFRLDDGHPLIQLAYQKVQLENYIRGSNRILRNGITLDAKDLGVTDSKIDTLSKTQLDKWNKLKSEEVRIEKTKARDLELGEAIETIGFQSANISEEEAKLFQEALGTYESPGEIGKYFVSNHFRPSEDVEDITLSNGNIIYAGEQVAIALYTSNHYRLINGTMDNDTKNIQKWKDQSGETDEFVREAQGHVIPIAEVAASGMNKLPPYKGVLYRGASMTPEKLEEFRQGTVILTKKFFSCSVNVDLCEEFAKVNAKENIRTLQKEYMPVLYVFKSENAKDIDEFSESKGEEERVYPPGQGFRTVEVDEKTIPGLAIVYMQEIN